MEELNSSNQISDLKSKRQSRVERTQGITEMFKEKKKRFLKKSWTGFRHLPMCTIKMDTSAGVTPLILDAWPSVLGFTAESFWRASEESDLIWL